MGALSELMGRLRADALLPENADWGTDFLAAAGDPLTRDERQRLEDYFAPLVFSEELDEWFEVVGRVPYGRVHGFSPEECIAMAKFLAIRASAVLGTEDGLGASMADFVEISSQFDRESHMGFPVVLVPLWAETREAIVCAEIHVERTSRSAVWVYYEDAFHLEAHCLTDVLVGAHHLESGGELLQGVVPLPTGQGLFEQLGLDGSDLLYPKDPTARHTADVSNWPTSWTTAADVISALGGS